MTSYNQLSTYKQEDYLEIEILKYLQKVHQPVTRPQMINYLITNVENIPNDALKIVISKKTRRPYQPFKNRVSFSLTSLYKAKLIKRPSRGITEQVMGDLLTFSIKRLTALIKLVIVSCVVAEITLKCFMPPMVQSPRFKAEYI